MAGFTFGAGNARALLRAPLHLAGAVAARLRRRDDRLWVFGSGIGLGEGALVLHDRVVSERPDVRAVWLCSDPDELAEARARGMRAALKGGWRGFRATLRAGVVVVTHGYGDVNRYGVSGAFVVQLWHGIPFKRLHLDTPAALRLRPLPDHSLVRRAMSVLYRRAGAGISLFPAASAVAAARLRSAFGLAPGVTAVTGDPRDDVLLDDAGGGSDAAARALLEAAVGPLPPTVVLYAPTWRDGEPDPGVPDDAEWAALETALVEMDAVLLVRPHPLGVGDYARGTTSSRVRLLHPRAVREVTPVLPAVDVLVTDYSSIAYDFSLLGRPTLFLAPDLAVYEGSRGFYEPYRDFSGGAHAVSWAEVVARLPTARTDPALLAHAERLRREHFDLADGGAAHRVLAEIVRRTGGPPARPTSGVAAADPVVARVVVDRVEVTAGDGPDAALRVSGPLAPSDAAGTPSSLALSGPRLRVEARVEVGGGRWSAALPLTAARWSGPRLPLPSGDYRVLLGTGGAETARAEVRGPLPAASASALLRLETTADDGVLRARVSAPLRDDELGSANQRRLERSYRRHPAPPEPAVFFESFYSQVSACNPRALDARLAALRPDLVRYWSTVDASVEVPTGAVRVVEGTAEWWRARAAARLLVVNDWLRKRYRRRPHQRVLQTWHGTMLKRLALDRDGVGPRTRLAVLRESARWDVLLAQNDYGADRLRSAYRYRGELWVDGYPRDDALADAGRGPGTTAAAVRTRLGLDPGARVVLYAPTWRDDRVEIVDHLDVAAFASEVAARRPGTVTLVRGHSRTLRHGRDLRGAHLLDVTSYPDITDLLLVTDVLVTDYSSLMFDFSATGRPMVFHTPDLRHYSADLRGLYFDLTADAPGAIADTRAALVEAVDGAERDAVEHAERYAAWRERFTPHDDGGAADRIVRRILDAGLLD